MKTILCILTLLVFTASTADAYVRRTVGGGHVVRGAGAYSGRYAGGHVVRGYYGHPVARGAAVAAGAAAVGAAAGQPYYGGGYYGAYASDDGYPGYGGAAYGYAAGPYGAYAAGPYGAYGYGTMGCAPWPRVGAFAGQPWSNLPTCPPY
jgi:hypothetical protein